VFNVPYDTNNLRPLYSTVDLNIHSMARPGASRSTTASSDTLQSITVDTDSARAYSSNTTASTSTIDTIGEGRTSSGRVKRVAGLKEGRMSEGESTPHTKGRTVSGETLVEKAGGSQSSLLQQGLAALNLPWRMSSFFKSTEEPVIGQAMESSQSPASIQESETPRSVLMKERADRVKARREKEERERAERAQKDNEKATRRSSRLDLVEKATQVVDVATSVLGKRSRDALEKGKGKLGELKRRASLRPRDGTESVPPSFEGPLAKRLRLEDSSPSETVEATKAAAHKPMSRPRTKRWLSQGLYVGQNRNFDPRLTDAKNRARLAGKPEPKERKILPLPMYSGQRLLEHGRDFKLPYDIFSPLPPGQPKPDEWKKTNKSEFTLGGCFQAVD
jgi:histone-lysine N-methyltransferase ASH1L